MGSAGAMQGEEEEEEDEDYMDPRFLHMAAELDNLDLFDAIDSGGGGGGITSELLRVISPSGRIGPPPPTARSPDYAAAMMYDDPLAAYGVSQGYPEDNVEMLYSSGQEYPMMPGDSLDFSDHPAFAVLQSMQQVRSPPSRPPSRMNF